MTSNRVSDAKVLPDLLKQSPADEHIESVSGGGTYDTKRELHGDCRTEHTGHYSRAQEWRALERKYARKHPSLKRNTARNEAIGPRNLEKMEWVSSP